jgi:hypothetical protein
MTAPTTKDDKYIREKRLISKIYFIIFPFFKDLAVLYREKCIKGRVQIQNFAYMKGTGIW